LVNQLIGFTTRLSTGHKKKLKGPAASSQVSDFCGLASAGLAAVPVAVVVAGAAALFTAGAGAGTARALKKGVKILKTSTKILAIKKMARVLDFAYFANSVLALFISSLTQIYL
jgi:hypothetical protein